MWFWLPYLTLSIDANVQRVSLTLGAIYDSRRPLSVEVIAFCQAVQRTGLHTTWVTQHVRKPSRSLHHYLKFSFTQGTDSVTWPLTEP